MSEKHQKLKQLFMQSLVIFFGLAMSILFFFLLFQTDKISGTFAIITKILRPFVIGGVLAYIMKSTCNFLEKNIKRLLKFCKVKSEKAIRKISEYVSLVLTFVVWLTVIAILLKIVIPQLIDSVFDLVEHVPGYLEDIKAWAIGLLADMEMFHDSAESIVNGAYDMAYGWVNNLLNSVQSIEMDAVQKIITSITGIVSVVFDVVIGIVVAFFLLKARKGIAAKCVMVIHSIFKDKAANAIIDEFSYADHMFSGFLEGKVIDSSLIGVLYYIVLSIMNIPYAPLIAVLCGVTNIIPIFGPFIGAIPSGLIILAGGEPVKVLYFAIFVFILQFLDGYIIDPFIVGDHVNMSSISVIFAVIFFGGLWGFFGLLVGVPTYAVIYDIIRKIIVHQLKKRGKYDLVEKFNRDFRKNKHKQPPAPIENLIHHIHDDVELDDGNGDSDNESDKENEEAPQTANA